MVVVKHVAVMMRRWNPTTVGMAAAVGMLWRQRVVAKREHVKGGGGGAVQHAFAADQPSLILDDFSGLVLDFLLLVFMHDYVTNFV